MIHIYEVIKNEDILLSFTILLLPSDNNTYHTIVKNAVALKEGFLLKFKVTKTGNN